MSTAHDSVLLRRPSRSAVEVFDKELFPPSLSSIKPILLAASEIQKESPRVAYLCCFYASQKADSLDPGSIGPGVQKFKTALLQRLEGENVTSQESRVMSTDYKEMASFYEQYYARYVNASNQAGNADRFKLIKMYETAGVLFEVLSALRKEKVEEVAPEVAPNEKIHRALVKVQSVKAKMARLKETSKQLMLKYEASREKLARMMDASSFKTYENPLFD